MHSIRAGSPREGTAAYLPAALLLVASTLAVAWLDFRATDAARPTLAVFRGDTSLNEAFAAAAHAGGSLLGRGPLPATFIVQSKDPSFLAKLRKTGAWLLLDARGWGGCATRNESSGTRHDE